MVATEKKRGRPPYKSLNGEKEQRKENFMRKILNGNRATKAASFSKRKPTLFNKAEELQNLCHVSVCVLCFGPDGKLDVWPKDKTDVYREIINYKQADDKVKKESNLLSFLEGSRRKLEIKKKKAFMEEHVFDGMSQWLDLDGLSKEASMDSILYLDSAINKFKNRIKMLKETQVLGDRKGKSKSETLHSSPITSPHEFLQPHSQLPPDCLSKNNSKLPTVPNNQAALDQILPIQTDPAALYLPLNYYTSGESSNSLSSRPLSSNSFSSRPFETNTGFGIQDIAAALMDDTNDDDNNHNYNIVGNDWFNLEDQYGFWN